MSYQAVHRITTCGRCASADPVCLTLFEREATFTGGMFPEVRKADCRGDFSSLNLVIFNTMLPETVTATTQHCKTQQLQQHNVCQLTLTHRHRLTSVAALLLPQMYDQRRNKTVSLFHLCHLHTDGKLA